MQRKSKHFFLIFLATLKMGGFLYRLHYVRQPSTVKFWKCLILTKPFGFDTMNTEAIRKPQKTKGTNKRGLAENAKKWKTKRKQDTYSTIL